MSFTDRLTVDMIDGLPVNILAERFHHAELWRIVVVEGEHSHPAHRYGVLYRETREGWPLPTKSQANGDSMSISERGPPLANGDSRSISERGPSLVGWACRSCTRDVCSLAALDGPVQNISLNLFPSPIKLSHIKYKTWHSVS
jgi:hypothetical protein